MAERSELTLLQITAGCVADAAGVALVRGAHDGFGVPLAP